MAKLQERGRMAAIKYLELQHYEILERDFEGFIVADDGGAIVFASVKTSKEGFSPVPRSLRSKFENAALAYMMEFDIVDRPVRCDRIEIHVIADDRAFVRHAIKCLD